MKIPAPMIALTALVYSASPTLRAAADPGSVSFIEDRLAQVLEPRNENAALLGLIDIYKNREIFGLEPTATALDSAIGALARFPGARALAIEMRARVTLSAGRIDAAVADYRDRGFTLP